MSILEESNYWQYRNEICADLRKPQLKDMLHI